MHRIYEVPDYPGGFGLEGLDYGRLKLFASEGKNEIVAGIMENAAKFLGIQLNKPEQMKFDRFAERKFGKFR